MLKYTKILTALCISLATLLGYAAPSSAQQNPVTAIDIALEPDATMVQHAKSANDRLLRVYPKGFALDATHHAHITMLQQFVRTADLDKAYAAANTVLANAKPTSWKLRAFKYYYIPAPPIGIAGIVIEPTKHLTRLQQELLDAIAPFTVKTGTAAAFVTTEEGRDIQEGLIDYVTNFVSISSRQEIQSARHIWCCSRSLPEGDAHGIVRGFHVLAGISVGLSTWHFWYGPQRTQSFGVAALMSALGQKSTFVRFVPITDIRAALTKRKTPGHCPGACICVGD